MANTSPGFSGFMSNMMNGEPQVPSGRGPPAPLNTQGPNAVPPPNGRAGNNPFPPNRPDLRNNYMDDGINIRENFGNTSQRQSPRAEMKGPSDISDILSGLKTKTINIQEPQQQQQQDSSTISISDLKELQSDGNMPKKSGRRKKSSSNTVSLDI
jgi:hypothetical protein